MKTLREDLDALSALLAIDTRIEKAKQTIAALDTGTSLATEFNSAKPGTDALRKEADRLAAGQKDAELQLGTIEERIANANRVLYSGTIKVPKELENLQKELEMLGRQKDTAELRVLESMEAAQAADAEARAAEDVLKDLARRFRKVKANWQERSETLKAEIASLEQPRVAAAGMVERAELLKRYDILRPKKAGLGAAILGPDNGCGACHTKVNTTLADLTRAAGDVQFCEFCQRILIPSGPVQA